MSGAINPNPRTVINPNQVILGNKGYLKINDIELAELKDLEIKIVPEMKEISLIDSVTKGKMPISFNGVITFEINKMYSRFKPIVLECAKHLQLFTFNLDATVYSTDEKDEETIYIDNCWLEGDINLFALKSDNDFLSEKYEAGFEVESAGFSDFIDDYKDWNNLSYKDYIEKEYDG